MENNNNFSKGTYIEALKIWDIYARIQKQITDGDYTVEVQSNNVTLSGTIGKDNWIIPLILNKYDRHTPSILSENAVPYIGENEIYTNCIFHPRSNEAEKKIERICGFELKRVINLIGGGGTFPKKICEAIDEFDKSLQYET